MSRRFGRNQKRRMQQQIDNLREAQSMDRGLAEDLGRRLRNLENEVYGWNNRICALLGHASGFTKAPAQMAAQHAGYEYQIEAPRRMSDFTYANPKGSPQRIEDTFRITMHRLEVAVDQDLDLSVYAHLYIGREDHYGYYMSRSMVDAIGLGEEGTRYVAREIAHKFMEIVGK